MTLKMTFCRRKKCKAVNILTESIITLQNVRKVRKLLKFTESMRKYTYFS